jgi:exodeoxyribonuclease V alpha subunit
MTSPASTVSDALATVRGTVEALFFSSPKFSAGRLRTGEGAVVSFAGALMVRAHDAVVLHGTWELHSKFGRQLKVTRFEFDQQLGPDGLAHYLSTNPAIKGIGPVKARRIAEAFGNDFDRVIDEEPDRVGHIAKLPRAALQLLRDEWLRTRALNASLAWMSAFELTHHQMTTLISRYGNSVVTVLQENPYLLVREIPGFGFKHVDHVARKMGTPKESPGRIRAGVVHAVVERLEQGDCWVDYEALIGLANVLLVIDVADSCDRIEAALDALIHDRTLSCVSLGGRFLVALPHIVEMEQDLAEVFATKCGPNPHFDCDARDSAVAAVASRLHAAQQRGVELALAHNLVLISGSAGTGKTHLISALTELYERRAHRVALAAPTGKAAKRIEQVVGRTAFTIHRMLGYKGKQFSRGIDDPIDADVLIVDEVSMVDIPLAWHLFRAINFARTAVVLVGDHNQLPPVGPGNLLRDLIDRQPIPTVILDQVVRQAGVLKENSIAVLRGEVRRTAPAQPDGRSPWVVANRFTDALAAQKFVLELFDHVLVEQLGFDLLADVQLLTPTRKGPLGVDELNVLLQQLVQEKRWGVFAPPPRPGRRPELLRRDRVIQNRNNYELGVMNGAIGVVTEKGDKPGELKVRFEDLEVAYSAETVAQLSLAYALTVHKYQGSQIPCVVLVVHKAHSFMHHRNLFYTGVTRAQQTAIIVGDQWGMRACAEKEQVDRRKTFLSVLDLPRRDGGPR